MKHYELATIIGHRGVPYLAPENSLYGLNIAAQLGYRWCEIDAQATTDGIAMVYHNFKLEPLGSGWLSDYTAAALSKLVIGEEASVGEIYMPTLAACLAYAASLNLSLVVEIKSRPGRHEEDVAAVVQAIHTSSCPQLLLASFSSEALVECARLLPGLPLALNTIELPREPAKGVANVHFDARQAHPAQINALSAAGLGVYAYTVNDPARCELLMSMGVNGVFTDNPALLDLETAT